MSKEKQIELKLCPFCGGKAKVKVCDGSGDFYTDIGTEMYLGRKMTHCLVRCERCRARTQAYLTRRGVFNAWNRIADNKGYRKQSELTPCDVCKFNPPTSGDNKPCFICPAQVKGADNEK